MGCRAGSTPQGPRRGDDRRSRYLSGACQPGQPPWPEGQRQGFARYSNEPPVFSCLETRHCASTSGPSPKQCDLERSELSISLTGPTGTDQYGKSCCHLAAAGFRPDPGRLVQPRAASRTRASEGGPGVPRPPCPESADVCCRCAVWRCGVHRMAIRPEKAANRCARLPVLCETKRRFPALPPSFRSRSCAAWPFRRPECAASGLLRRSWP